jgi:hypothetical protein
VAEAKGIDSDNLGVPREAVNIGQVAHHKRVDVVAPAPVFNGLAIMAQATQDLVYVAGAGHIPLRPAFASMQEANFPACESQTQ